MLWPLWYCNTFSHNKQYVYETLGSAGSIPGPQGSQRCCHLKVIYSVCTLNRISLPAIDEKLQGYGKYLIREHENIKLIVIFLSWTVTDCTEVILIFYVMGQKAMAKMKYGLTRITVFASALGWKLILKLFLTSSIVRKKISLASFFFIFFSGSKFMLEIGNK